MQARRPLRGRIFERGASRHEPGSLCSPFVGTPFEHVGRIPPERLGEGVAHIGAIETDIGEHARVEASQDSCVTPIPEDAGKPPGQCDEGLHGIPPECARPTWPPDPVRRYPESSTRFSMTMRNMAPPD
jgi:hypothetical protein